jgi:hypothetical protein
MSKPARSEPKGERSRMSKPVRGEPMASEVE